MGNELTVTEVAEVLGVVPHHVHHLIHAGKLKAEKFGRDWRILRADLARFERERRPRGRPRKDGKR